VSAPAVDSNYFDGTPQEWIEAHVICLERYGLVAIPGDPNDSPSFEILDYDMPREEMFMFVQSCRDEIGSLPVTEPTEESVIEAHGWLMGQYRCFVAAGFDMEPPPSLESSLDQVARVGLFVFDPVEMAWDSVSDAHGNSSEYSWDELLALCPRSTEEWPQ